MWLVSKTKKTLRKAQNEMVGMVLVVVSLVLALIKTFGKGAL